MLGRAESHSVDELGKFWVVTGVEGRFGGVHADPAEQAIAWTFGYRHLTVRYERHGHLFTAFLTLASVPHQQKPGRPVPPGHPSAGSLPLRTGRAQVLYLVIRNPHKNRTNVTGKTPGWKAALNALSLYYGDRITLH
jgi:hypothetical protein